MRDPEARHDVAVIGGGPAGSTVAALLAGSGRTVALFEKEIFPRFHIGESLLPFNMDLFDRLGVSETLEECFLPKYGARLISSDGRVEQYIDFSEAMVPGHPMAYQVLRSRFDEILLQNAAARGARIHEGAEVVEASTSSEGCTLTVRERGGHRSRHAARFLVDASGRDAFLASRRDWRRMNPALRKVSFFAHYEGVDRAEGPRGGDIILILMRDGWFWFIPLAGGTTSVGLVTDASKVRGARLDAGEFLAEALARCPAARGRMRRARRITPVRAASDYSYACDRTHGDAYLMIGDAAAFIDPIWSSGVWLAMSSAEMAADTLNRILAKNLPPRRRTAALSACARAARRRLSAYSRMVSRFYEPGFLDVLLVSGAPFGIREAVITFLAGLPEPPIRVRIRIRLFYLLARLQRRFGLFPRAPLLDLLEEAKA